ncbi:MAG: DUF1974 domain-containing protein, partial [Methylococcales bacterium]|nr:DUF1974 domain-containing protein [Methylococcales bacterium]
AGIYINENPEDATGRIETAFNAVIQAAPVEVKLHAAQKQGQLEKGALTNVIQKAIKANIITETEADLITKAEQARRVAINVDDFASEQLTAANKL